MSEQITGRVWLDGVGEESIFEAVWYADDLWNGWLSPYLTKDDSEAILRLIIESDAQGGAAYPIIGFQWEGSTLVIRILDADRGFGDEVPVTYGQVSEERIPAKTFDGVQRWSVGAWSWTWSKYEEEQS